MRLTIIIHFYDIAFFALCKSFSDYFCMKMCGINVRVQKERENENERKRDRNSETFKAAEAKQC